MVSGSMWVAIIALIVSLIALRLFLIANYNKIARNWMQYPRTLTIEIFLESGSITKNDGSVTVGGPPGEFDSKLIDYQRERRNETIPNSIEMINHPQDTNPKHHFDIKRG